MATADPYFLAAGVGVGSFVGEVLELTVVVFEGLELCLVCVVVVAGAFDVLAGVVVSVVFFFTHEGCAGGAAGSPVGFTHGGRNVVRLDALSLAPRFTLVIGILLKCY